jgi:hypothetical protein
VRKRGRRRPLRIDQQPKTVVEFKASLKAAFCKVFPAKTSGGEASEETFEVDRTSKNL